MNFHKTIGFLATLLLVFGLGVPDSFAQTTVTNLEVTVNPMTVADNNVSGIYVTVTANVTLNATSSTPTTVSVALSDEVANLTGDDAIPADQQQAANAVLDPDLAPIEVVVPANTRSHSNTKIFLLTPATDADLVDEKVVIRGTPSIDGTPDADEADDAILTITDTDAAVSALSLEASQTSFADNATSGSPLVLTATVTLNKMSSTPTTVSVALSDEVANLTGDDAIPTDQQQAANAVLDPDLGPIEVVVPANTLSHSNTKNFVLTPAIDADLVDEKVVIRGTPSITIDGATNTFTDQADDVILTITDTDAAVSALSLEASQMSFADNATSGSPLVLTATVTLNKMSSTPTTVSVALSDEVANLTGNAAIPTDQQQAANAVLDPDLGPIEVVVPANTLSHSNTKAFVLTPATDADLVDEKVVIRGTPSIDVGGTPNTFTDQADDVILTITDTDVAVSALSLEASQTSFAETETGGSPLVLTATVTLNKMSSTPTTVSVALSDETANLTGNAAIPENQRAVANDRLDPDLGPIEVVVPANTLSHSNTKAFVLTPETNADDRDRKVVIRGTPSITIDGATNTFTDQAEDVTLTIQDPSNVSVPVSVLSLSFSPSSLLETDGATDVTVTAMVSLEGDTPSDRMETVNLSLDPSDNVGSSLSDLGIPATLTVSIDADEASGEATTVFTYDPTEDADLDDATIAIKGMVDGTDKMDVASLTIRDTDVTVSAIDLSIDPSSLSEDDGPTAMTLSVTVTVAQAAASVSMQTVNLSLDATNEIGSTLLDIGIPSNTLTVSIPANQTSGSGMIRFVFDPPDDSDVDHKMVVVKGAIGSVMGTGTLTITNTDVVSASSVDLVFDPSSVNEGAGNTAVTLTATVTLSGPAPEGGSEKVVTLSLGAGNQVGSTPLDIGIASNMLTVSISEGQTSNTGMVDFVFPTPAEDSDLDDQKVVVTGSVDDAEGDGMLTVKDATTPSGTIKVSTSLESIRENSRTRDVVVTAELDAAPSTGTTVMVEVTVTGGTAPVTTQIPIVGPATSNTVTVEITPVNDDVFTVRSFTVTGRVTGYESGTATIDIVDDDATIGEISISAAPPSITVGSGSNTVNLTINVIGQTDTPAGTVVVVDLATDAGVLSTDAVTVTWGNHPNQDPETYRTQTNDGGGVGTRGTATLTVDAGSTAGVVATVTATSNDYVTGTRTISALGRDAQDVHGYRVLVNKSNQWVAVGDNKVFVDDRPQR